MGPLVSILGPVHAGLIEATHDRLAASLDRAGADLQALGAVAAGDSPFEASRTQGSIPEATR